MTNQQAESLKRNDIVQLSIPSARPIRLLSGVLHEAGQDYKFLGWANGCLLRLSRVSDFEKITVLPQDVSRSPLKLEGRMIACGETEF